MPRCRKIEFSFLAVFFVWQLVEGCASPTWVFENSNTTEDLHAVIGMDNGDIFAVGNRGTVLVRQNGKWQKLDSGIESDLHGVWGQNSQQVIVVGDDCTALRYTKPIGEQSRQAEYSTTGFTELEVASCSDFRDVDGYQDDTFIIVGAGKLQHCTGQQCTDGPDFSFRVLGASSVSAQIGTFVVGDGGKLAMREGDNWNMQTIEVCPIELQSGECPAVTTKPILWDIWVGQHGQGYILGSFGGLWHYPPPEEGYWSPLETGVSGDLRSAYGMVSQQEGFSTQGFAVGADGVILELQDERVKGISVDCIQNFYDVWMSADGSDVYAVGAQGTIAHLAR